MRAGWWSAAGIAHHRDMDECGELLALERVLLAPGADTDVAALLDEGFHEAGRSGRRWTRAEAVELVEARRGGAPEAEFSEVRCRDLGAGSVLLTYTLRVDGHRSLRSTVWRRGAGGWRAVYHQGTAADGEGRG